MDDIFNAKYGDFEVLDQDIMVCKSLSLYGEWAQNEIEILSHFMQPDSCVIDAGAFIGTHALAFGSFVGPQGKVYAFEPQKKLYDILSRNINRNKYENIITFNEGLGKEEGTIFIPAIDFSESRNFGALSLLDADGLKIASCETIRISTIDNHCFDKVDLIKIDVEGMEFQVLTGACDTIRKCKPIIFAEVNSLKQGVPVLEFSKIIGYRVYACLTPAYNERNFRNEKKNIFGVAKELGLILIPERKVSFYTNTLAKCNLEEIENIDELALVLSHKPQYPLEVFQQSPLSEHFNVFGYHYGNISKRLEETRLTFSNLEQQNKEINVELSHLQNQLGASNSQIQQLQVTITHRDQAITERDMTLSHKDRSLQEAISSLSDLQQKVAALEEFISEKEQSLQEVASTASGLQQKVAALEEVISEKEQSLQEAASTASGLQQKVTALEEVISEKEQSLQEAASRASGLQQKVTTLESDISQKNLSLSEMNVAISEKDRAISSYREELYSVYTSKSWRYMLPMRTVGTLVRRILATPHRPHLRAIIKQFYFKLPRFIRLSKPVESLKNRFKQKEGPRS